MALLSARVLDAAQLNILSSQAGGLAATQTENLGFAFR
jgi:hypothetical protein